MMTLITSAVEAIRRSLLDDMTECWIAQRNAPDEQVHRRNYVRAVFAMVDGFVSAMKAYVLDEYDQGRFSPTRAEIAALYEEGYTVDDQGRPNTRPAFAPTKNNVRFAFDIFARAHGVAERPDYSGAGWSAFQTASDVRNRVTHPKVTADLDITDDEVKAIDEAFSWFLDATFVVYVQGRANVMAALEIARRKASS